MKKQKIKIHSGYLHSVYDVDQFKNLILLSYKSLLKIKRKHPFEAIAFTGTSGAALAYPLSYKLKIPLICVRKSVRDNHFKDKLEGAIFANSYIIVDDCIDSGKTIKNIIKNISLRNQSSICKGVYLYNDFDSSMKFFESLPVYRK